MSSKKLRLGRDEFPSLRVRDYEDAAIHIISRWPRFARHDKRHGHPEIFSDNKILDFG